MTTYITPKVDSLSIRLATDPLGSKNVLRGEPVKVGDLEDHLQAALKDKGSYFAGLVKPVATAKAERYYKAIEEGADHEQATLAADTEPEAEPTEDPTPAPNKAEADAREAAGGPAPVAGSSTSHALPSDHNPTPAITNDADAQRRTATEAPKVEAPVVPPVAAPEKTPAPATAADKAGETK